MTPAPQYEKILGYVYALVVIVVAATVIFMTAFYQAERSEGALRNRIAVYYLASSAIAEQVRREIDSLLKLTGDTDSPGLRDGSGLRGSLFAIQSQVDRLKHLQETYKGDEFAATLRRLEDRFDTTRRLLQRSGGPAAARASIAVLDLNAKQLYRLHMNAATESLDRLDADAGRNVPTLIVLATILLVSAALGWIVARLLRRSLVRQAETEEELRANRERMYHMQKLDALGQLVGGVAHDFNNMLTAILGQTQLLQDRDCNDSTTRDGLKEISQASRQAASLTKQLLTFSRRLPIETQATDLNELIRRMEPVLRRLIGEKIELEVRLGHIRDAVELDPGQMHQVILNLLINARDAMPDGGTISIATEQAFRDSRDGNGDDLDSGDFAKITITDNGVGMDEDTLAHIFEPFFSTKPRGRGTGLGLATVHGIVTAANGHVLVDSVPGEGSRFEIYWPVIQRRAIAPFAESQTVGRGSETVLIVEDARPIRSLLSEGLGALGYRVLTAAGGREGLEVCATEPAGIDVIVSDVVMPGMNGAEFMRQALHLRPGAAAIFMSGYTDDIVLQQGVSGANIPLINKPFELPELAAVIREQLNKKDAARADSLSETT